MMLKKIAFYAAVVLPTCCPALVPFASHAANIAPTSYNMPNGDGQASGGSFNYWDRNYTGSGATTTDGASLSGGVGKLTDGFVSTSLWFNVSNSAGTGDYVGWYGRVTLNPVITFNFAGSPVINSISIQMDNSGAGGVYAPASILIDGVSQSFSAPTLGTVGSVVFSSLSLSGGSHTIQFQQAFAGNSWTFVSEISFDGVPAIPEPETYAMLLAGLGLLGFVARRRKRIAA